MCGIYLTNIPFSEEEVKFKLDRIKYRGPDYTGILKQGRITLGHLRLAILDLDSRSNQPYIYKNLTIVFNGEIYNFKEIRLELEKLGYTFVTTSDTEVLIKGFDAWDEKVLDRVNGMFAFAIYDNDKQEIFCARDRMGVKPFFYYLKDGQFEICSQLQPLIRSDSKISREAVAIYLSCGYVPSPLSIIEDISKLQPGHILRIDIRSESIIIKKYWDLQRVNICDISYDEAKNKLEALIKDAVRIRLQSDVPLGTFLSGGIDSALVTALATEISDQKIKTFTIGFDDPKFDESKVAEEFSSILGTEHTTTVCKIEDVLELIPKLIEVYDEPFADSSALPSLLLNKITKQHVTVALSGDGGDESFFGYNYIYSINKFKKVERIPFALRRAVAFFLSKGNRFRDILHCKTENEFIERVFVQFKSGSTKWWLDKYYSSYKILSEHYIQKAADLNIKLWLENDSNVKVDRASMAYSVEVRSPLLDYRIVEFARDLPINFKFDKGKTKIILRDILAKYIPEKIFDQPKSGFSIPLESWIKNDLKQEIDQNITLDSFKQIADFERIYKELKLDHSQVKWRLYLLSKWLQYNYQSDFE